MYNKEEEAIRLVVKAFEGMKRHKEDINLAVHSITVGYMLKEIGCSEDIVLSGFLHDIIEDTKFDYDYLVENFGEKVAKNVLAVSEDTSISNWKERKVNFLERIKNENSDVVLVEMADKLHNLLSDYNVWLKEGNLGLATKGASYEENKWYYLEMKKIFNNKLSDNDLLRRYNEICKIYFEA